jgi:hypothetical protein
MTAFYFTSKPPFFFGVGGSCLPISVCIFFIQTSGEVQGLVPTSSYTSKVESKFDWAEDACLGMGCGPRHGMHACVLYHWDFSCSSVKKYLKTGRRKGVSAYSLHHLLISHLSYATFSVSLLSSHSFSSFFKKSLSLSLALASTCIPFTTNNQHPFLPFHFSLGRI